MIVYRVGHGNDEAMLTIMMVMMLITDLTCAADNILHTIRYLEVHTYIMVVIWYIIYNGGGDIRDCDCTQIIASISVHTWITYTTYVRTYVRTDRQTDRQTRIRLNVYESRSKSAKVDSSELNVYLKSTKTIKHILKSIKIH